MEFSYCPKCRTEMAVGDLGYNYCQSDSCNFVQYQNPTPVVAAVVEYGLNQVIVAHNKLWPQGWFGLITGFLEKHEHPDQCVIREVKEELGLEAEIQSFIGHYSFKRMNQIIIAYHLKADAVQDIVLDDELDEYKIVPFEKAEYWPAGTGYALRDFLTARGYDPALKPFS